MPIYKIVYNWFKDKKGNRGNERELEVLLLDKSEENDEDFQFQDPCELDLDAITISLEVCSKIRI